MLLKKLFGFDPQTMSMRTEIIGGITTFLTMIYILAVNPDILSTTGMDKGALFTTTAIVTAVSTLLIALMAKMPFAQAPSMGLNAFFAFTLVQAMGYSWQTALAALFVEGLIFLLITFLNVRELILESIPMNLRYAVSAGIGLFIAFIGLKNAGIIASDPNTFVTLGKFTPTAIIGIFGILLSGIMLSKKIKGALFYSIILSTAIGIPLGVTQIPEHFTPVSVPNSIAPIFCQFDFSNIFSVNMLVIVFILLIINIFDTLGTLVGLASKIGIVKADGSIPHVKEAMMSDAIGTTLGSVMRCSTVTTYLESASGIAEGARSGLASAVTSGLFLIALLLSPLFMIIPTAATTGALVLVGVFMMDDIKKIEMSDISESLPAFITMIMMILTYSIADGICLGLLSFVFVKLFSGQWRQVKPTLYILAVIFIIKYAV